MRRQPPPPPPPAGLGAMLGARYRRTLLLSLPCLPAVVMSRDRRAIEQIALICHTLFLDGRDCVTVVTVIRSCLVTR